MGYKYNQKSVRLSDEVLNYINSYPKGDNFNEKFENIVLFVFKNENDIQERLVVLNKEIDTKCYELAELKKRIIDLLDVERKLNMLLQSVDLYIEGVEK